MSWRRAFPRAAGPALVALGPCLAGFSSTASFDMASALGGGDGKALTGSPTAHDMSCAMCHQGAVRTAGIRLGSVPSGLFSSGFTPGTVYTIEVAIENEARGLDRNGACADGRGGCNRNSFVAEWLDIANLPAGALCVDGGAFTKGGCDSASGAETTLFTSGKAISGLSQQQPRVCSDTVSGGCIDVAALAQQGQSQEAINETIRQAVKGRVAWHFQWRAPTVAYGPVRLFLGVVDGDGGTAVDTDHNDYFGDDVYLIQREIRAAGAEAEPAPACSATGAAARGGRAGSTAGGAAAALLVGLVTAAVARARRQGGGGRQA